MEHWPRLSSQRMKRRAHTFFPSHDGPVTCIAQQSRHDASKFITSGQDGSVCVWNASSGKELFRMEGFSSVSSLACLGRELLVTNGMNEYVCVHDFGIAEDAASNGYELEW
jgi:WD40 repeat protein